MRPFSRKIKSPFFLSSFFLVKVVSQTKQEEEEEEEYGNGLTGKDRNLRSRPNKEP